MTIDRPTFGDTILLPQSDDAPDWADALEVMVSWRGDYDSRKGFRREHYHYFIVGLKTAKTRIYNKDGHQSDVQHDRK